MGTIFFQKWDQDELLGGTAEYVMLMREASDDRSELMEFYEYELNLNTKKWKRAIVTDSKVSC